MTKKAPIEGLRLRPGTGRFIHGVPRRDLTGDDLARLVYRSAGRIRPGDAGFAEAVAARRASLIRSGLYEEAAQPVTSTETATAPAEAVAADSGPENDTSRPTDETAASAAEES